MSKKRSDLNWCRIPVVVLLVFLVFLVSCSKLQEKYIKQDKLFRIAQVEDSRGIDTLLTSPVIISDPDPEIRAAAAIAIGRINHPYYRQTLYDNLYDTAYEAAAAKYFAAGLAGDSGFVDTLFALARNNQVAREVALEALGRLADSSRAEDLAHFLDGYDTDVTYQTILALWRSSDWSQAGTIAQIGMTTDDQQVKYAALYALARGGRTEGRQLFLSNLGDPNPELRMLAYSGLGRIQDTSAVEMIAVGLNDDDYRVAANAIYALRRFGSIGAKYIGRKLPELTDEKLVELAVSVLGDNKYPGADKLVEDVFGKDNRENVRAAAAEALLKLKGRKALMVIDEVLPQPTAWQKTRMAEGLTAIDTTAAATRLGQYFNDSSPIVRASALEALGQIDTASIAEYIEKALGDQDIIVSITAIDIAARLNIKKFIPEIAGLYLNHRETIDSDLKMSIIDAWRKFEPDSTSEDLIKSVLVEGLNDESYIVRKEAASVLKEVYEIDRDQDVGYARSQIEKQNYRTLFHKYKTNPKAVIVTGKGRIVFELLYDVAPMTVNSFIALAESGYYDSLLFHRVIPNFVIQDGCPRGDGWGGPGYYIRCENNRLSYKTGMVGMALSGKDTGGSQYFITLSPQPHLDANYTIFGRVISGMEVAQQIVRGDRIDSVTIEYEKAD